MSTPKQREQTESEIARNGREYLRRGGWMVRTHAQDIKTRRASAGLPDDIAFRHGVTLLVEYKTRTGRRREAQERFFDELQQHIGPCLWYVLARDVEALERITALIEECRRRPE